MNSQTRIALWLAVGSLVVSAAFGQEPAAKSKPKIEYRWMENFYIKGVTEEREIYASEDINQHWFLHKKPIETTYEANQKLAKDLDKGRSKWLAVLVDGRYRMSLLIGQSTLKSYPEIFHAPAVADKPN
jgi:hypothetical protein